MQGFKFAVVLGVGLWSHAAPAVTPSYAQAEVCDRAGIVMIGKVTARTASEVQKSFGNLIFSDVTLTVERMIHGPNLSTITILAPGGDVGSAAASQRHAAQARG